MSVTTFLDSFDHYATADLLKKWDSKVGTVTIEASGGRRDSGYLKITPGNNVGVYKALPTSDYLTVGGAIKLGSVNLGSVILTLLSASTPQIFVVYSAVTQRLDVYRHGYYGGHTLLASTLTSIPFDVWTHIELGTKINDTGTLELRVNGSSSAGIESINVDTLYSGSCDGISLGAVNSVAGTTLSASGNFDDFKVSYGTALLWHGDRRVDVLQLSADSTPQDFTVSSGNAWEALNGNGENIQSSTVGHISRFVVADPSFTPNFIDTIQIVVKAQKSDSGNRAIKLLSARNTGTWQEDSSNDLYLSETLKYYTAEFPTDPATGIAWTESALRELIVGIELSV